MMLHTRTYVLFTALLIMTIAGPLSAQAATVTCPPAGTVTPTPLSAGNGEDLEVTGPCTVGAGTYHYRNVNVYGGGSLTFEDAAIEFWAMSILVENDGSLTAGTPEAPIGTHGGVVALHLYGPDQGPGTGQGVAGRGSSVSPPKMPPPDPAGFRCRHGTPTALRPCPSQGVPPLIISIGMPPCPMMTAARCRAFSATRCWRSLTVALCSCSAKKAPPMGRWTHQIQGRAGCGWRRRCPPGGGRSSWIARSTGTWATGSWSLPRIICRGIRSS